MSWLSELWHKLFDPQPGLPSPPTPAPPPPPEKGGVQQGGAAYLQAVAVNRLAVRAPGKDDWQFLLTTGPDGLGVLLCRDADGAFPLGAGELRKLAELVRPKPTPAPPKLS